MKTPDPHNPSPANAIQADPLAQIAATLPGYDANALPTELAWRFLEALVQPVNAVETVALQDALGRVVAHDIISPVDVPAHDNSAMDGYAFAGSCLRADAPTRLECVGTAFAGAPWVGQVGAQQCLRIMTGAILPAGLDTVVPQELVERSGAHICIAAGALQAGDNRRLRGEDLQQGQVALPAGSLITPAAWGLLASLGQPQVTLRRRLRVAHFSTGDEILSLGEPVRAGAVYDSNRYTLMGLLRRLGVEAIDMGVVPDAPQALRQAFAHAAAQADAVITSGGVSVGEADHTKSTMQALAQESPDSGAVFWKIAMRPGRPMAVARLGQATVFGLPGNPVAVMVTFLALVRPALLRMMGASASPAPLLQAHSVHAIRKKPGRTEYQRGIVSLSPDGRLQVQTTGQQGSGVLNSMVQANGLIVLHHDQGNVAAGESVSVLMFDGAI
jgi:molybdopterin molybdotransferase